MLNNLGPRFSIQYNLRFASDDVLFAFHFHLLPALTVQHCYNERQSWVSRISDLIFLVSAYRLRAVVTGSLLSPLIFPSTLCDQSTHYSRVGWGQESINQSINQSIFVYS